jgi:hypothetical protein
VRWAVSIDSSMRCWRFSRASEIRGNASLRRRKNVTRKASSVQIMSPTSGLTRKLLFSSAAWASGVMMPVSIWT